MLQLVRNGPPNMIYVLHQDLPLSLCQLPSLSAALSEARTLSAKERSIVKHSPMRSDTWTACYCHEEGSLPGSLLSRCSIATVTRCNSIKITAALDEHSQAVVNLLVSTATPDLIMRIMHTYLIRSQLTVRVFTLLTLSSTCIRYNI